MPAPCGVLRPLLIRAKQKSDSQSWVPATRHDDFSCPVLGCVGGDDGTGTGLVPKVRSPWFGQKGPACLAQGPTSAD
ncbi:hypothetical protein LMH87_001693 [Akanthomyces muscarius]|uniref:Uncharacterized protein n=1 Tax=Akanthomyces muscarius TaxID=2231603 RepID=A0A9W8Q5C1_AKAMU|nr:hypothetical protein LMH87_001693 [Akanthomyces muscarius]KAJ4147148.1 hypothetical protein LMH87_001693 [Akanthomyces muscarius]